MISISFSTICFIALFMYLFIIRLSHWVNKFPVVLKKQLDEQKTTEHPIAHFIGMAVGLFLGFGTCVFNFYALYYLWMN